MTQRAFRRVVWAAVLWLGGCASVPTGFDQRPSSSWSSPETTQLGDFFARHAPASDGLSGVLLLPGGPDAFVARYSLAALAQHTLDLQYYLWKGDLAGGLLLFRALRAADRGVQVRLLIDDIYHSGRDDEYAALDIHPNLEVRVFNPMGNRGLGRGPNFLYHKSRLNHRMHNKIFLADNAVAVLGGRNIGDDYFGIDPKLNFRDLDVLTVGPAAQQAGAAFDTYWNSPVAVPIGALLERPATSANLVALRRRLNTALAEELGEVPYQVPHSVTEVREALARLASRFTWTEAEIIVDPLDRFSGEGESIFVTLGHRLAQEVEDEVTILTAYLIPTREGVEELRQLVDRGVRVRILTNSLMSNNHLPVHAHYRKYRKALLKAGVELYELRADAELLEYFDSVEGRIAGSHAGLHTKAFVVDRRTGIVGSYNMDPRSRIWNSEIGLVVHGEAFGELLAAHFDQEFDPVNSFRVTLNENGKLRWTAEAEDGVEVFRREPGASIWRRALARIISWLPIEKEL